MEIAFESRELREICEHEAEAKAKLGDPVAAALKSRLADLDAAMSPSDLVAGRPRIGEDKETMVIDLCQGYRIVFAANHPNNPLSERGEVDWRKVSRVRILRIERDNA